MSASDQDGEQAKTKNMAVKTKDLANNGMPKRGRMTNRAKQRSTGSNLSVFGEIAQGVGELHRPEAWDREERQGERLRASLAWYFGEWCLASS